MLDQKTVAHIRESGLKQGATEVANRNKLLREELGFRVADKAEYVLLASCALPFHATEAMRAFSRLLRHFQVDYTLLPEEYCCGLPLFSEALVNKSEEDLEEANRLAPEFVRNNLKQMQEIGASKIITFCMGCDMTYHHLQSMVPQEVIWYPTLLARLFRGGKLRLQADYYAGCHNLERRLSFPLGDQDSPLQIMNQIEGLEINELNHHLCCARPKPLASLAESVQSKTIITTCGNCTLRLQDALKEKGDYRVVMLPQVAWAAISGEKL